MYSIKVVKFLITKPIYSHLSDRFLRKITTYV